MSPKRNVHLVGSVNLPSAEEVFVAASKCFGPLIKRIPDGETGPRLAWIGYQGNRLRSVEGLELLSDTPMFSGGPVPQLFPRFGLKSGVRPE